jgi:predicted  nucleic acid-binding Zn-ribbon protein
VLESVSDKMEAIRTALDRTPGDIASLEKQYADIQTEIQAINVELYGLESRNRMGIKPANIESRLSYAMTATWSAYGPTRQHREQFAYALEGMNAVSERIKALQETAVPALQQAIVEADGPWTSGAPVIMDTL